MDKTMKQNWTLVWDNTESVCIHVLEQQYNEAWLTYYFCPFSSESLKSYLSIFLDFFQISITIWLKENLLEVSRLEGRGKEASKTMYFFQKEKK